MEKIYINSTKGNIAAVLHSSSQGAVKLAVICPGYLDTKDYNHLIFLADKLSEAGYDAVRFDPTGTWESEGDIKDYTLTQQLADFRNVIEYMNSRKNYSFILVGGHSRGGLAAMLYAAQDSRVSEILAIMSPYALVRTVNTEKISKWKEQGYRKSVRDIPNSSEEKEFDVPYSDVEDGLTYDVFETLAKSHIPLVLVAGELDNVVPLADVKRIYEKANEPKKLVVLEGIDHGYRRKKSEIELVNKRIIKELEFKQ
jgi:uncharacterized protein